MVTGKLGKDLIIGKITAAVPGFDLSSEGLVLLNVNKVDGNIVKAMFDAAESARRRGTASSVTGIDEVLNNEIIIRMVTAKVSKDLIIKKMGASPSQFDVSSAGLVNLNTNKVPSDVIKMMMLPPPPPAAVAPEDIPVRAPVGKPNTTTPPKTTPPKTTTTPKTTAKPPAQTPPPKKPPV
jgi:hypothetical protein